MQDRYWMFRRSNGVFYVEDKQTGKQTSLRTKDITTAKRLFTGTNQAAEQPEMAGAFLFLAPCYNSDWSMPDKYANLPPPAAMQGVGRPVVVRIQGGAVSSDELLVS